MDLLGKKHLEDLKGKHPDTRNPINAWIAEIEEANWETFQDIKNRYATVDHLGNGLHVFNIKGNKYRIAAKIYLDSSKTVLVKAAGTHEDYLNWKLGEMQT
jgi:mRNA interferase HigB